MKKKKTKYNWSKRQRKGIENTINKKWLPIYEEQSLFANNSDNCPLCKLYLYSNKEYCKSCPIAIVTGISCCIGFSEFNNYVIYEDYPKTTEEKRKELAMKVIKFLKGLLK